MLTLQILPHGGGEPLEQSLVEYIIVIALKPCCSNTPTQIGPCLPGGPLSWKTVIKFASSIGIVAMGPDMGQPAVRKWHVPRWEDLSVAGKVRRDCSASGSELQLQNHLVSLWRPSFTQGAVKWFCWIKKRLMPQGGGRNAKKRRFTAECQNLPTKQSVVNLFSCDVWLLTNCSDLKCKSWAETDGDGKLWCLLLK